MRVMSVNNSSQSFKAKTEYDNYYEKSHIGKSLGFGIGVGCLTTNILHAGGFKEFYDGFHKDLITAIEKDGFTRQSELGPKLTTKLLKKMATTNMLGYVALMLAGCTLVGGILDALINAGRRDNADGRFV